MNDCSVFKINVDDRYISQVTYWIVGIFTDYFLHC
jgi:hypothetical protein